MTLSTCWKYTIITSVFSLESFIQKQSLSYTESILAVNGAHEVKYTPLHMSTLYYYWVIYSAFFIIHQHPLLFKRLTIWTVDSRKSNYASAKSLGMMIYLINNSSTTLSETEDLLNHLKVLVRHNYMKQSLWRKIYITFLECFSHHLKSCIHSKVRNTSTTLTFVPNYIVSLR